MTEQQYIFFSTWLDPFFLWYFAFVNAVYTIVLILGAIKIYLRRKELAVENHTHILRSNSLPEISFIIPVYNGAKDIISTVENILNISYRYKQIIVVNDGSTDHTLDLMKKTFSCIPIPQLYTEELPSEKVRGVYRSQSNPEILLIDKDHGRRFDTLNAGINACSNPLFISIDADTYMDSKAFEALIRPILTDPKTIGVGAGLRIRNGCVLQFNRISTLGFPKNYLCAMQTLEYLRAFLMRQGWDYIGGNILISGAFSVFSREAVVNAGGYGPTVAEDMEIVTRLHRIKQEKKEAYQIRYLPDPTAWTDGPATLKKLSRQRTTWHKGIIESMWFHKKLLFNFKHRLFGLFVMPFWVIGEVLEPVVETLGYIWIIAGLTMGFMDPSFVLLFLCVSWGFTILFTPLCLLIEELSFKEYPSLRSISILLFSSLIENIGYRQMTIWWRLKGFVVFLKNFKTTRINTLKVKKMVAHAKSRK